MRVTFIDGTTLEVKAEETEYGDSVVSFNDEDGNCVLDVSLTQLKSIEY